MKKNPPKIKSMKYYQQTIYQGATWLSSTAGRHTYRDLDLFNIRLKYLSLPACSYVITLKYQVVTLRDHFKHRLQSPVMYHPTTPS